MRFMMRKYLLILGIPSVALLFLPYTHDVSPWATVSSKVWGGLPLSLLGGPFFLSIPILIAQTRVLFKRPFSKGERATYRVLAYAALAAGLPFLGSPFTEQGFSRENIQMSFVWGIPCAAAIWMMILSAKKLNPEEATTVALQAAWLPNAILCAVAYWNTSFGDWQIGAYLAAFTIVLYTVEITLSMGRKRQTPGAPLANPT
jgi:CRISPR-associated Cas5-like protein